MELSSLGLPFLMQYMVHVLILDLSVWAQRSDVPYDDQSKAVEGAEGHHRSWCSQHPGAGPRRRRHLGCSEGTAMEVQLLARQG